MKSHEFIKEESTQPNRKEYDYYQDQDTTEYVATWNGQELGRFKPISKWNGSAAEAEAKKAINAHFMQRYDAYNKAREREIQFGKPLSQLELEWIELDKKILNFFNGGPALTDKEEERYKQLGPVLRKSLYAINDDDLHPAMAHRKGRNKK